MLNVNGLGKKNLKEENKLKVQMQVKSNDHIAQILKRTDKRHENSHTTKNKMNTHLPTKTYSKNHTKTRVYEVH